MSYVKHILQPGEQVLVIGKLHWIIYLPAIFWMLCAALCGIAAIYFQPNDYQWVALAVALVFLVFGLVAGFRTWLKSFTTEIAVTTTRVVYKTGFINRHTNE
jgi:hypothetical protein